VVAVAGELDLHSAGRLRSALELPLRGSCSRIIVDLVSASFIDSSALGVLTAIQRTMRAAGGEVVVVANDPRILRPFRVTGLDGFFQIRPSLLEAMDEPEQSVAPPLHTA